MSRSTPKHLNLFKERSETVDQPGLKVTGAIHDLCQAFERATGWSLRYVPGHPPQNDHDLLWSAPVSPGVGASPGHLRIDLGGTVLRDRGPSVDLEHAGELAGAIGHLFGELLVARDELRKCEAELAAAVPVIERPDDPVHLAERLEAVLRGGAQAVNCHAAAIYLLDAATTELKLRGLWSSSRAVDTWSTPTTVSHGGSRSTGRTCRGDEEPRDPRRMAIAPEASAAAVCVPIATSAIPLGTLWIFSARERDFTDDEVNLVEIVAGRLASDLEREVLMQEGLNAAALKRQVTEAERLQEFQLPRYLPSSPTWDVDAWTLRGDTLGGDFYDWFPHDEESLGIAVGSASGTGIAGGDARQHLAYGRTLVR